MKTPTGGRKTFRKGYVLLDVLVALSVTMIFSLAVFSIMRQTGTSMAAREQDIHSLLFRERVLTRHLRFASGTKPGGSGSSVTHLSNDGYLHYYLVYPRVKTGTNKRSGILVVRYEH